MDDTSERLVRLEEKIDSLIQLNNVRITAVERKIDEVERTAAERTRHEKANYDQKLMALQRDIDSRATKAEVDHIKDVAKTTQGWLYKGAGLVLTAALVAVLALVIIKPGNHSPQATAQNPHAVQAPQQPVVPGKLN